MTRLRNALFVFLLLCRSANAVVVEGTNIKWLSDGLDPYIGVLPLYQAQMYYQNLMGYSGTTFVYDLVPDVPDNFGIEDITHGNLYTNWYLVNAGDEFDAATIAAGQF
jgi:hypothetical protein